MPSRAPIHPGRKSSNLMPRKNSYQRGYNRTDWEETRKRILKRDKWRCVKCDKPLYEKGSRPNIDHIIDKADGGTDEDSNLRTLCPSCHSSRTAKESGGFGNSRKR